MPLTKLQIPAGISRNSTEYAAGARWYDCDNIRFRGGFAESIGGWVRDDTYTLEGIGRACFSSRDYSGNNYQFVGTNWKYYVIVGGVPYDITAIDPSDTASPSTVSNPFKTTSGSPFVEVRIVGHGRSVDDWINFVSIGSSIGDSAITDSILTQITGFQITEVPDLDTFYIQIIDETTGSTVNAATTSASYEGGSVGYHYRTKSGSNAQTVGMGWGTGIWGGTTSIADVASPYITVGTGTATLTATCGASDLPEVGDIVRFSGLTGSVNGVDTADLNGNEFTVLTHASSTSFTFTGPTTSGGGTPASTGGANGKFTTGRGWGEPSTSAVLTGEARRVYIDNYGEDIIFANSGSPLYYWDTSASTVNGIPGSGGTFSLNDVVKEINSSNFTGASDPPTIVDSFLISKRDGSCVGFGTNDLGGTTQNSLLVRWSDQNNPFDWTPTPVNTAGGQVLRVGSRIVGAVSTKDEVVIFTDAAVYSMRFIGPPDVFSFSLISQNVEILSHKTAVDAASSVFFMGNDGFYVYGGGAVQPLECPVADYVYDDINMDQANKSFAAVDSKFSEIFWFYPSKSGATNGSFEANRFVCFNYENQTWTIGSFDMSVLDNDGALQSSVYNRTAWRDAIITDVPMAAYIYQYDSNPSNVGSRAGANIQKTAVMKHDFGTTAQGSVLQSFIESGDVELSDGNELSFYSRIIPDLMMFNSSGDSAVTVSINGKYYPGDSASEESSVTANFAGPTGTNPTVIRQYTVGSGSDSNAYVESMQVRGRARAAAIKVTGSNSTAQWRLGDVRIDTQPDGMR